MTPPRTYALDPLCRYDLALYLYKNVRNVPALLAKAKDGSLKCAMLNPRLIYDPFQIVVAANRAVLAFEANSMTTHNVYSEIIYCLSPTKNITKSLATFGMAKSSEDSSDVLVAILHEKNGEANKDDEILSMIDGEASADGVDSLRSVEAIKKAYSVNGNVQNDGVLLDRIVTMCAVKV